MNKGEAIVREVFREPRRSVRAEIWAQGLRARDVIASRNFIAGRPLRVKRLVIEAFSPNENGLPGVF